MKFLAFLALFAFLVILCEKYEDKLFPPLSWIFSLWKKFSHILGIIMSFLILSILWIVGFGLYGIILKIITLPNKFKPEHESYWLDATPTTKENMIHQF